MDWAGEEEQEREVQQPSCLRRISSTITGSLEAAFFHVGRFVGQYPVLTIVLCLLVCGLCGIGLKTFEETEAQEKLWVPQSSRLIAEKAWADAVFPRRTRFVTILVQSQYDILTSDFFKAMLDYYSRSVRFRFSGMEFTDFCARVGSQCHVTSLLELWQYNMSVIRQLRRADILEAVNQVSVSPNFGYDISTLLGGRVTRINGKIKGATATQMTWVTSGHTEVVKEWEKKMIYLARNGHPKIWKTYVYASRSFDDEGYGAVDKDITLLTAGFSIVFIFVMLSLGKFSLQEHKIYLSLAGMGCVGLSLLFAYGLATAMDLIYSPIQSIMPFLLLGIGVDDMFVVVEAWKNLSPEEQGLSVPDKLGSALRHAGVSITVTSITDAVAFGVGASTVVPALSAFCVYAVLGIVALFLLVSTFFSACLALDEKRRRRQLDACLLCYRHKDPAPSPCAQGSSLLQTSFSRFYGPFLMKTPVKVCVVLLTLVLVGVNIWSFTLLRQEFKLSTYIPTDSYAFSFTEAREKLFVQEGVDAAVYCGGFDYSAYRSQLEAMYHNILTDDNVQNGTVNAWFFNFHTWLNVTGTQVSTEQQYVDALHVFLSSVGISFKPFISFDDDSNPTAIEGSYITLRHVRQLDSASEIAAMDSLRSVVDGAGLPENRKGAGLPTHACFAYSDSYMSYETNRVLLGELYRNLLLAGVSVLVVTCVLIADPWTSGLVFLCVIFTVVDVAGMLQFWGTTIDTASSILLTLTVGLAVDYSAHVGHTFMTISGPRTERAVATLRTIGPAVFNGGFSTFLAFVLLANSTSYGFVVFFRVFSTVVLFGLFHGLALLPVLLSVVGPPAYLHADAIAKSRQLSVRSPSNGLDGIAMATPHATTEVAGNRDGVYAQVSNLSGGPQAYAAPFIVSDSLGDAVLFTPRGGSIYIPAPDY